MTKLTALRAAVATAAIAFGTAALAAPVHFASDFTAAGTTAQGGDIYGYQSNLSNAGGDWQVWYSPAVANTYNYGWGQLLANQYGLSNAYFGIALTTPGAHGAAKLPSTDISDAKTVMVHVGNYAAGSTVMTIVLANGKGVQTLYTDPNADATATSVCSADITLVGTGGGAYDYTYPGGSATGLNTYSIPLKSFKCSKGKLPNSITVVGIQMNAAKNAGLVGAYTSAYPVVGSVTIL